MHGDNIKVRRVDWYFDEWLAGTARLDAAERGVYVTICSLIYSHGGPIQSDGLAKLCGCHGNSFKRIMQRLRDLGKIVETGGRIAVKRCGNELEKARIRLGNAQENGRKHVEKPPETPRKRGRGSNEVNNLENGAGYISERLPAASFNLQPPTNKDSEAKASDDATASAAQPDPVKILWDKGLALLTATQMPTAKARTLIGRWRREFSDPAVMSAIVACEQEAASDPVAFIAGCLHAYRKEGNGNGRRTPAGDRMRAGLQAIIDADREEDLLSGEGVNGCHCA